VTLQIKFFIVCFALCFSTGCDQGLEPEPPPQYGIAGTIYFRNWPPPDSVRELALAAFKVYPGGDVINEVFQGKARITFVSFVYGDSAASYALLFSPFPPGTYEYIAVGQRFGPNRFSPTDWRIAGVYYSPGDTSRPGTLFVPANQVVQGVNIDVDFRSPPPPPS